MRTTPQPKGLLSLENKLMALQKLPFDTRADFVKEAAFLLRAVTVAAESGATLEYMFRFNFLAKENYDSINEGLKQMRLPTISKEDLKAFFMKMRRKYEKKH